MEWPLWSTVLKWHRIATHLHSIDLGSHFQHFAVTPSAVPLRLSSLFPPPPLPPIRVHLGCKKQGTALYGPDAATTPRNTHPTSQSGRCSRDIACLIGRGGCCWGCFPPFCHALSSRTPPHMYAVPKAQVVHTITIVTPRARIVFVRCIPLRRDQATISGTWDAPPPKTHARILLPLITSLAGQAVRSWPGQAFRAWFHHCCAAGSLEPRRTFTKWTRCAQPLYSRYGASAANKSDGIEQDTQGSGVASPSRSSLSLESLSS
ncbi:hypothetical protein B0T18DRAFT_58680 [Schizothecium vesticola]|uniref:Uncharacterized protein n=1 Tax=Schizothecium vesticola TaxID=314040 RepID=A0AA40F4Q1_9PEZI|nr:hypothetical protein B0T18DRAFT_58680 [Schizothecium vesticola]